MKLLQASTIFKQIDKHEVFFAIKTFMLDFLQVSIQKM